jgi:hypothetical protein
VSHLYCYVQLSEVIFCGGETSSTDRLQPAGTRGNKLSHLAKVFVFKITVTILFWCAPLIILPSNVLEAIGFPAQPSIMFVRLLGWAYLSLCVGYGFGLCAALKGENSPGPVWMGIVSNGGACVSLTYFGVTGAWSGLGGVLQFAAWSSVLATAAITLGLFVFGGRGKIAVPTKSGQTKWVNNDENKG